MPNFQAMVKHIRTLEPFLRDSQLGSQILQIYSTVAAKNPMAFKGFLVEDLNQI